MQHPKKLVKDHTPEALQMDHGTKHSYLGCCVHRTEEHTPVNFDKGESTTEATSDGLFRENEHGDVVAVTDPKVAAAAATTTNVANAFDVHRRCSQRRMAALQGKSCASHSREFWRKHCFKR